MRQWQASASSLTQSTNQGLGGSCPVTKGSPLTAYSRDAKTRCHMICSISLSSSRWPSLMSLIAVLPGHRQQLPSRTQKLSLPFRDSLPWNPQALSMLEQQLLNLPQPGFGPHCRTCKQCSFGIAMSCHWKYWSDCRGSDQLRDTPSSHLVGPLQNHTIQKQCLTYGTCAAITDFSSCEFWTTHCVYCSLWKDSS